MSELERLAKSIGGVLVLAGDDAKKVPEPMKKLGFSFDTMTRNGTVPRYNLKLEMCSIDVDVLGTSYVLSMYAGPHGELTADETVEFDRIETAIALCRTIDASLRKLSFLKGR